VSFLCAVAYRAIRPLPASKSHQLDLIASRLDALALARLAFEQIEQSNHSIRLASTLACMTTPQTHLTL
jgi:hypothetical protein